jgi:hypothetical protein
LSGTHTEIFGGSTYSFLHVNTTTVKSFFATNESALLTALFTFSNHPLTLGTNNTERMRITSGGHVGIKITPNSGWGSSMTALQLGTGGVLSNWTGANNNFGVGVNYYDNGSGSQLRLYTGGVSNISFNEDVITFSNAASSSAGTSITFNTRLTITSGGVVRIANFTTNGLVGTDASGNLGVVISEYTEIATGTITYSMNSGSPWAINNSFPATIRNYEDDGMVGSGGVATSLNLGRGVTFDLGSAKAVRRIVERGYHTKNLNQIIVQYSTDNSNWTDIYVYNHVYGNTQKNMEFNPTRAISARYWRWFIHSWSEREVQNYYTYESIIYT